MNRCFSRIRRRLRALSFAPGLAIALTMGLTLPAMGQTIIGGPVIGQTPAVLPTRTIAIPSSAVLGVLQVLNWPQALLNGQPALMSPGSRIRDPNSLILTPASLYGQTFQVLYVIDPLGLIRDVWLLTSDELAALQPPPPILNSP